MRFLRHRWEVVERDDVPEVEPLHHPVLCSTEMPGTPNVALKCWNRKKSWNWMKLKMNPSLKQTWRTGSQYAWKTASHESFEKTSDVLLAFSEAYPSRPSSFWSCHGAYSVISPLPSPRHSRETAQKSQRGEHSEFHTRLKAYVIPRYHCGVVVARLPHTQEDPGSTPGRGSYLRQVSLH